MSEEKKPEVSGEEPGRVEKSPAEQRGPERGPPEGGPLSGARDAGQHGVASFLKGLGAGNAGVALPKLSGRARGSRLVRKEDAKARGLKAKDRLHLLDMWQRSGLPAGDFAALVGQIG